MYRHLTVKVRLHGYMDPWRLKGLKHQALQRSLLLTLMAGYMDPDGQRAKRASYG